MSPGIVNGFEMIDIDQQQRRDPLMTATIVKFITQQDSPNGDDCKRQSYRHGYSSPAGDVYAPQPRGVTESHPGKRSGYSRSTGTVRQIISDGLSGVMAMP
jgi:hypothetical protein